MKMFKINELLPKKYDYKTIDELNENCQKMSYYAYHCAYDKIVGTEHAKLYNEKYMNAHDEIVATIENTNEQTPTTTEQTETTTNDKHIEHVTYNNGQQRNIIGNLNDNEIAMTKCFNHLNAMKRSLTLSQQSDDNYGKLFHENIMYRELFALELSMRKLQQNIKNEK